MQEIVDYSELMNRSKFKIYVEDYYSPVVSPYFTGLQPAKPMLNGVEVSADEYNAHEGITDYASDEIIRHAPLQTGNESDMTISAVSPAEIVDMCINEVKFTIVNTDDVQKILNIMESYRAQILPYESNNKTVQAYMIGLNQAIHLLDNNLTSRINRDKRISYIEGRESDQPQSLVQMLDACF